MKLANYPIKYLRGLKENVTVKVGKSTLPTDFMVLDMEEDREIPFILGIPLLAINKALIDVQKTIIL